ncbi:PH domain-containing protein [Parerythrobacter lacustris]|uniref:PH domain-containing protein n=1 Tax=Parerythrobacter lacustris TaxID=2969984 RepID=A0ABT1XRR0_9SPHN|nr:PH domain-containing protein [Parerythrobacter lacustris]MCR2834336.1 PH domain-containing protein [Parerythrobacter lacustris]
MEDLTKLDPRFVTVTRIRAALATLPVLIAAIVLESADLLPLGAIVVPVVLLATFIILRIPLRRWAACGYDMGSDRLRVVRGLLFRSDTVVPFGRVQHIDLDESPLERAFGLSTLTVHTAGTHNASVKLPGLASDDAAAMREAIREHIKRETL